MMSLEMVICDCKSAILADELGIAIARLAIFCQNAARAECPSYSNTKGMDHALKLQHVIKGLDTMIATAQSLKEELSKGH